MDAINKYLKTEAMKRGLCQQWTEEWGDGFDTDELLDRFIQGLDFCIENDFPSPPFIKENFEREVLEEKHIYVDNENISTGGWSGVSVVMGQSYGEMNFDGHDVVTLWVRHDSELLVTSIDHACVLIHCLDNCKVRIEQGRTAKVVVRKHSDACEIIHHKD